MGRKRIESRSYHEWAAEIYEHEKGQPTPAREVLAELGHDLDAMIARWRQKRARQAARRVARRRR